MEKLSTRLYPAQADSGKPDYELVSPESTDEESIAEPYADDDPLLTKDLSGGPPPAAVPRSRFSPRFISVLIGLVLLALLFALFASPSHKRLGFDIPFLDQTTSHSESGSDDRKALVLASFMKQDVDWLKDINSRPGEDGADNWEVFRYVNDAAADSDYLKVENPYGREMLAYLTFIVDNYDELPETIVFAHGHDKAWHQPTPLRYKLWALNISSVQDEGYFNIRCDDVGCTDASMWYFSGLTAEGQTQFRGFWQELMEADFGPMPHRIGLAANAQFAASKTAIRKYPHEFWRRLRDPFLKNQTQSHHWAEGMGTYDIGIFYEPLWHVFMGKEAEFCPGDDTCNKQFFSNKIHCDRNPPVWGKHQHWKETKCEYYERGLPEGMEPISPFEDIVDE